MKQLAEEKINKFKQRQKDIENAEEESEEEDDENSHYNEEEDNEESEIHPPYSKKVTLNKQSSIISNESNNFSKQGTMSKLGTLNPYNPNNKDMLIKQESIINTNNINNNIKKDETLISNSQSVQVSPPPPPVQKI